MARKVRARGCVCAGCTWEGLVCPASTKGLHAPSDLITPHSLFEVRSGVVKCVSVTHDAAGAKTVNVSVRGSVSRSGSLHI